MATADAGSASPRPAGPAARNIGIDVARGVAVVLMIQTHAYAGWVTAAAKDSFGYRLSRLFGAIPAPLFLFLAGVGLSLGAQASQQSGAQAEAVRARLVRRGTEIFGYGYLVSLAYAAIEGSCELASLFRADILHCIGLSLMVCSLLVWGRTWTLLRAVLLTATGLAIGLIFPRLFGGHPLPLALSLPAALFVDVPPFTRFPLLPLCGFTALGVAFGRLLLPWHPSRRLSALLSAASIATAVAAHAATQYTLAQLGGSLSRGHPAIVWNLLDGTARGLAVLFACLALVGSGPHPRPPQGLSWLVRLGRGSLLAYSFHIPFCFGRLASPLASRLNMAWATLCVLALTAMTYAVVYARDQASFRVRFRKSGTS